VTAPGPLPHRLVTIAHGAGNEPHLLQRALDSGVDMVEADVWAQGGRLLLRHDHKLPLLPILIDQWHLRRDRTHVTLEELLELAGTRSRLFLDIKSAGQEATLAVLDTLRRHRIEENTEVCSKHWGVVATLREAGADFPLFHSANNGRRLRSFLRLLGRPDSPVGLSIRHNLLSEGLVSSLKQRGVRIYAWIVRERARADTLMRWGIDGITSDDFELLAAIRS
jgi:glycerophosphoryl diester phosphodiesterase